MMPGPMPLRPTTVRFAEDGYGMIQRAADQVGSTISQFVREAAMMRAILVLREEEFAELAHEVQRLSRGDGDEGTEENGGH